MIRRQQLEGETDVARHHRGLRCGEAVGIHHEHGKVSDTRVPDPGTCERIATGRAPLRVAARAAAGDDLQDGRGAIGAGTSRRADDDAAKAAAIAAAPWTESDSVRRSRG